ncbi:hypothetical protein RHOFW104T7_06115 [Rhodanobacter thiooxydans]|uniref:Uncharacterized protein n=3 Tax=Rhodanobacteraceae TaxID=1775411 RepID=A0A154QL88_9GAMM|nr:hypothetical protein R2APBS1_2534 [Rhodanobacter denitrificans]KZC24911.1 hypothetical protein RHOFW104T7_06115 [Rhodanobacter thiooxydans]
MLPRTCTLPALFRQGLALTACPTARPADSLQTGQVARKPATALERAPLFGIHDMQPRQRIEAYLRHMQGGGIARSNFAPPIWTGLCSVGIFLPPPPFLKLPAMIAISAVSGVLLVLVLWVVFGLMALLRPITGHPPTLSTFLWTAPISAALMAIGNPIYYRRMARRHGLATW